jgi:hypothetical protein
MKPFIFTDSQFATLNKTYEETEDLLGKVRSHYFCFSALSLKKNPIND